MNKPQFENKWVYILIFSSLVLSFHRLRVYLLENKNVIHKKIQKFSIL